MIKLVKRRRITMLMQSGKKIVFDAASFEVEYDAQGIASYKFDKALYPPLYVYPRAIVAVSARPVWVWRRGKWW